MLLAVPIGLFHAADGVFSTRNPPSNQQDGIIKCYLYIGWRFSCGISQRTPEEVDADGVEMRSTQISVDVSPASTKRGLPNTFAYLTMNVFNSSRNRISAASPTLVQPNSWDPKTWLLFFFNIFDSLLNGGLTNFMPLIVNAQVLGPPCRSPEHADRYHADVVVLSCNGTVYLVAHRYGNRFHFRGVVMIIGLIVGVIAAIFLYKLLLRD